MRLEAAIAWWTGLALATPALPLETLLGTGLALHLCDAVLCRVFARKNGYPPTLWTVIGLVGGLWAVAALILLPRRDGTPIVKGRLP